MPQPNLTERLVRLRGVPVLRTMTTSELAPLAASMRSATFEKGDILLREDQPPRSFHLLVSGSVTMRRHGVAIRNVSAPGTVGFLPVLARTAGGTEAIAQTHTETFEVRADVMEEMFEDHFSVFLGALRWIAERLVEANLDQIPAPYVPSENAAFDRLIGDRELGIVDRIFLLRRTRAFRNANVNSVARLARRMKEVRASAGETIWRPGDRADGSIFIIKGKMELRWRHGQAVQIVGPGYAVGGAESFAGHPRWNELVTTEPAVFLRGSREAIIDMFEDDLEVALGFMSMMGSLLLTLWERQAEKAPPPPLSRDAMVSLP